MFAQYLYKYVQILLQYASQKFGCLMFDDHEVIAEIVSTKFVGSKKNNRKNNFQNRWIAIVLLRL